MPAPSDTNHAILLTPPGAAAIAVVRLLGPRVSPFLIQHFSRGINTGKPVHGNLTDGDRIIDDPVVVLLPNGAGADVSLHGGTWVVRSMIELARKSGFTLIDAPGAAMADALVEGRTEIEREVLASLGAARTELALRVLLAQSDAWKTMLDTGPSPEEAARMLADRSLRYLLNPPTVAIVGAANVGKSTLANRLFGQERSITADMPGTTRDWVGEIANIDGLPIMLVDTPGQRATHDPIERSAIEQSRAAIDSAELVLLVLDATRPLDPEQWPLLAQYSSALRIANKCDQQAAWDTGDMKAMEISATNGLGLNVLRGAILGHFGCRHFDPLLARCWTERQIQFLQRFGEDARVLG